MPRLDLNPTSRRSPRAAGRSDDKRMRRADCVARDPDEEPPDSDTAALPPVPVTHPAGPRRSSRGAFSRRPGLCPGCSRIAVAKCHLFGHEEGRPVHHLPGQKCPRCSRSDRRHRSLQGGGCTDPRGGIGPFEGTGRSLRGDGSVPSRGRVGPFKGTGRSLRGDGCTDPREGIGPFEGMGRTLRGDGCTDARGCIAPFEGTGARIRGDASHPSRKGIAPFEGTGARIRGD